MEDSAEQAYPTKVASPPHSSGGRRVSTLLIIAGLTWAGVGFWNSVKPMPPGTHVTTLATRLGESQVEFMDESVERGLLVRRSVALIDGAEQLILLDQCPLPGKIVEHLLTRKHQRPNLKIVLVTDPRNEVYGGTPAPVLAALEQSGVIVARTALDQLRDSNPLYSSAWRLLAGWWSDPFDEGPGHATLMSTLRRLNHQANGRRVLVADDGSGGWSSLVESSGNTGIDIRGHLARDIAASELLIARWSTDDDRLPTQPAVEDRSMGTIDARFLTESGISAALDEALGVAGSGDTISVAAAALGERPIIHALLRADARGAHVQLLIDPRVSANQAVAAELLRGSVGNVEVRWQAASESRLVLVRHRNDVWLNVGSADLTRRDLDDLNLEANVELHMPARAAAARAAIDSFSKAWYGSAAYATHADETPNTYWRYRFTEFTGLPML